MENKIIIFILLSLFLSSCENVVDVEIKSFESALIVEGGVLNRIEGDDNRQVITLKRTVDFLSEEKAEPVLDAKVMVGDGENNYTFFHEGSGIYAAEFIAEIGMLYRVEIEYEGDLITAEEVLGNVPVIDSIYASFEEETTFTDAGYFVKINTRDIPGERNFYHWQLFANDTLTTVPDPGNSVNLIAEDEFFDGQEIIGYKPNEEINLEINDKVKVEQWGISERYHDFLYQIYRQSGGLGLLGDPPPSRIRGNLFNETNSEKFVLGYFTVASVASAEMVIE